MRDDGVHEADPERFFGAEGVPRVAELARAADPDAAGEALRAPEAGDDAEVHLGLAELRLVARVDEVAREGELAPSAEGEAVHGGEDRDRRRLDPLPQSVPEVGERPRFGRGHLAHRADVRAGRERLVPGSRQDRAVDLLVGGELHDHVEELAQERRVDRVQLVRSVQRDRRDVPFARDEDRFVGCHVTRSFRSGSPCRRTCRSRGRSSDRTSPRRRGS